MVTFAGPSTSQPETGENQAPTPGLSIPFIRASDEHIQPGNVDVSRLLTASQQDLGVFDLPAYGYFRWLYLLVTAAEGAGAGAAGTADAPWNVLQNIALTEPNGAYIVQFNTGYELYLANKYGGYNPAISSDPKHSPVFSAISGTGGHFTFLLRIPIEVSARDAVGALPNQDSAGQFKLRLSLASSTTVFATPPATTLPTVRVQAWLAAWDQPEPSSAGQPNQTSPPAVGTTSFWSVQSGIQVNAGENTLEIKRKGNYIRQWIFVLRNTSGARHEQWPLETRFLRDAFPARYYNNTVWRHNMYEKTGYRGAFDAAGALDTGVRFHDYAHEFDGALGFENRDLWQPTRGSTRLELAGSFGAIGSLDVITNDVAIAKNVFL